MTRKEVSAIMARISSWKLASPEKRAAFKDAVQYVHYGYDPLTQAWFWFSAGWEARSPGLPHIYID